MCQFNYKSIHGNEFICSLLNKPVKDNFSQQGRNAGFVSTLSFPTIPSHLLHFLPVHLNAIFSFPQPVCLQTGWCNAWKWWELNSHSWSRKHLMKYDFRINIHTLKCAPCLQKPNIRCNLCNALMRELWISFWCRASKAAEPTVGYS